MWISTGKRLINLDMVTDITADGEVVRLWLPIKNESLSLKPEPLVYTVELLYKMLVEDLRSDKKLSDYSDFLEESNQ